MKLYIDDDGLAIGQWNSDSGEYVIYTPWDDSGVWVAKANGQESSFNQIFDAAAWIGEISGESVELFAKLSDGQMIPWREFCEETGVECNMSPSDTITEEAWNMIHYASNDEMREAFYAGYDAAMKMAGEDFIQLDENTRVYFDIAFDDGLWYYEVRGAQEDPSDAWGFNVEKMYIEELDSGWGYRSKEEAEEAFRAHSKYAAVKMAEVVQIEGLNVEMDRFGEDSVYQAMYNGKDIFVFERGGKIEVEINGLDQNAPGADYSEPEKCLRQSQLRRASARPRKLSTRPSKHSQIS